MRVHEVMELKAGLEDLSQLDLPAAAAWRVTELVVAVGDVQKAHEIRRGQLVKKHGFEGKDGSVRVEPYLPAKAQKAGEPPAERERNPAFARFQEEYAAMMEEEASLIKFASFLAIEDLPERVKPELLRKVRWIIKPLEAEAARKKTKKEPESKE